MVTQAGTINLERLFKKFRPVCNGCWEWTAHTVEGYGVFGREKAHRVLWELANNRKIKLGYLICHTCDNPKCVNPEHLFEGTAKINAMDASAKLKMGKYHGSKIQCRNGHPYNKVNTLFRGNGTRACKQCQKNYAKKKV